MTTMKSCGHEGKIVFDLPSTPLADQFESHKESEIPAPRHALGLRHCSSCTMVENVTFVDDDLLYGDDYAFFSGASPALVDYFSTYATGVRATFPDELKHGIVEIASNDGTFLKHFKDIPHLGVDPSGPPVAAALAAGLNVINEPFTLKLAVNMPTNQVVVANNVAAHVADLTDFLAGIAHLVGDTGRAIIEFQYLPDLLLGNQFDLIYHEHRRFLSLTALHHALRPHGLSIVDAFLTPTQGGSVRVVLAPTRLDVKKTNRYVRLLADEFDLYDVQTFINFSQRVTHVVTRLRQTIEQVLEEGSDVALYGAPAKATTLIHAAGLASYLGYAVDLTPYKIGRYMPGTDIEVIAPDKESLHPAKADAYLLGISNYLGSVIRRERSFLVRGGQFIVPLPKPVII